MICICFRVLSPLFTIPVKLAVCLPCPLPASPMVATGSWCGMFELPLARYVVANLEGVGEYALQRAEDLESIQ